MCGTRPSLLLSVLGDLTDVCHEIHPQNDCFFRNGLSLVVRAIVMPVIKYVLGTSFSRALDGWGVGLMAVSHTIKNPPLAKSTYLK